MGWTSFDYRNATHLKWTKEQAREFCEKEFNSEGYEILKFSLDKARTMHDRHVIYLVMKHPTGKIFLMVVLVDIINYELFFKGIPSSMGPVEDKCPVEFLDLLPEPSTKYDEDWRKRVRKNNVSLLVTKV